ncbi:MAG: acyl-CoA thioesterase II [Polyangiaceae bacterium]|nr:acyl-CoA thioesterase II [Polyangiaceae bacterium]
MSATSKILDELVGLLALEKIEENLFRGQSQDLGWGTLFGGHVLGQALSAAVRTAPADRHVHSLHAYFLRPGRVDIPVVYNVDRIRDGSSFTTRRVVAIQAGQAIFNLAASFQKLESGFEHQDPMPEAPPPESVPTEQERAKVFAHRLPKVLRDRALAQHPFELRPVADLDDPFVPKPKPPKRMVWLKTVGKLPDDQALHAYLLAYASDHGFITTSLLPHGVSWLTPGMQVASLDHVMWFHRPFRVDEWLLYVIDSPAATGARGLVRGQIFTREGLLVASSAQEGLIRQHGTGV